MLCLVRQREVEFTGTIESFVPKTPVLKAEFDASLSRVSLIWYGVDNGAEVAIRVCAVDLNFLQFGTDSSSQNLSEFIGAILAVMGQIALGQSECYWALRGDSVTALTWSITERVRGILVTNASMVWTLLCGHSSPGGHAYSRRRQRQLRPAIKEGSPLDNDSSRGGCYHGVRKGGDGGSKWQ
jgi:hypothetical protein